RRMSMPELLLDAVLLVLLLAMACGALHIRDTSTGIGLFIAFGIIVALVWARLGVPDLALAEAAIGAGLAGVLFLQAARGQPLRRRRPPLTASRMILACLFIAVVGLLLTRMMVNGEQAAFQQQSRLPQLVTDNLALSG